MVYRSSKTKNYTVISNYHLRDTRISNQAAGLLTKMLSLPDDWIYTAWGLASICKESYNTIRSQIRELERAGYIVRRQTHGDNGKWSRMIYDVYEIPQDVTEEPEEPEEVETPEAPSAPPPREPEPDTPKLDPDMLNYFRQEIRENIDYELLWREFDADPEIVTGYVELMAETCAAKSPIRVNGQEISPKEVQERFLSLDMNHILYVMECLRDRTHGIRNIRAYTLAALYNAPVTIDQYYETLANRSKSGD